MVRGTFFGLEIGRSGLSTAQFGLDVTGHNIANVETKGFTRQRIVSTAVDPFSTNVRLQPMNDALVGGGVRIKVLDQIRSAFLDRRFRSENTSNAYWETRTQSLSYLGSFFDNINEATSINTSIAEFFEAMTGVIGDPVGGAPRSGLQSSAMNLVQQFNMIYTGLLNLQTVENRAVQTKIGDVNRIASAIEALNEHIYNFELSGLKANDLRDRRNLLLDELSGLIDINYTEDRDEHGHDRLTVRIGSGQGSGEILVSHHTGDPDGVRNELGIALVNNPMPDGEPIAIPYWQHLVGAGLIDNMDIIRGEYEELSPEYLAHLAALFGDRMYIQDNTSWELWNDLHPGAGALDLSTLSGGEILAHIHMRDGVGGGAASNLRGIPFYIEMMNDLARALVKEINQVHARGWNDNPEGSQTGILFFDDGMNGASVWFTLEGYPDEVNGEDITELQRALILSARYELSDEELMQITARNIRVSDDVQRSVFNISASNEMVVRVEGDPEQLQRGNNENMRALYALFRETGITIFGGIDRRDIGSFDEFATSVRHNVGQTWDSARQARDTSRILTLAAENQRTAVAGVSLDEEMVGLVRFQHAYNGAARVITAMDDALDRLINGTGRVGL